MHSGPMTDMQLYLAIGIPTLAILVGILINGTQFSHAMAAINSRITIFESAANGRFASVETRLDMLIGKVMELGSRLTRLGERLERL